MRKQEFIRLSSRNMRKFTNSLSSEIIASSQSNIAVTKQALYSNAMPSDALTTHTHTHTCAISHACVIIALPSRHFLQLSSHPSRARIRTKHGIIKNNVEKY